MQIGFISSEINHILRVAEGLDEYIQQLPHRVRSLLEGGVLEVLRVRV